MHYSLTMLQQYYGEPDPTAPPPVPPENPPAQKPAQSHGSFFAVFVLQTAVCAVILAVCLILKFFVADAYAQLAALYQNYIAANADIGQVLQPQTAPESEQSGVGGPEEKTGSPALFVMPVQGTVTSAFGYRADPFTSSFSLHGGYDIGAPAGTPIVAATDGVVALAETGTGSYGNYIIIKNEQVQTLYGHLLKVGVTVGQSVKKGQLIGQCGSTGRSTGPHLHFEVRVNGTRIDPAPFLSVL